MTDVVNPKIASPDQLLPYHKKISAEGKALMKCFISYTYMVLKCGAEKFRFVVFSTKMNWVDIVKDIMQSEYSYGDLKGYMEWQKFLGLLDK